MKVPNFTCRYCHVVIIIINVSFMQGSHTHIPETNHVPRGSIVPTILSFLFMVPLCLVPALALYYYYYYYYALPYIKFHKPGITV